MCKRTPRTLLSNRITMQHEKAVDTRTGSGHVSAIRFQRLGFRTIKEVAQDNSEYGGTGEHYACFTVYELAENMTAKLEATDTNILQEK